MPDTSMNLKDPGIPDGNVTAEAALETDKDSAAKVFI